MRCENASGGVKTSRNQTENQNETEIDPPRSTKLSIASVVAVQVESNHWAVKPRRI